MNSESRPPIYLVDDEPNQLFLIKRAAERTGEFGEIRTAIDSHLAYEELLELAVQGRRFPHLVITDWKMPGLSGAELACALREHPQLKDIAVVALSSSNTTEDRDAAMSCGCKAFYQKPLSFSRLTDLMREIVRTYAEYPRERAMSGG